MMKELAASNVQMNATIQQNQAETKGAIAEINKQLSQLATTVSELKKESGRLPSQTVQNPRENEMLNTMTRDSEEEVSSDYPGPLEESAETLGPDALGTARPGLVLGTTNFGTHDPSYSMQIVASEGHTTQKDELEGRLEARNRQNGLLLGSSLTTNHESPPGKGKDPGAFTVTCGIGEAQIHHCLIDLGAAVNAMPYSLYCSLGLGPLKPPKLLIELGDKSCICPVGVLEDLILRVGELVISADFYVLQMGDARKDDPPTLILGRPFLYSTKARIDMGEGLLSLAFGGRTSEFYIYDNDGRPGTRKPSDIVNTSDLSALVPDLPRETVSATRLAAMVKTSLPTWVGMKGNPPEQWRPNPSTSFHGGLGRIKGSAAEKFDLTRPWDPNL
ncbi:unnamed protein product [Rhodiola kirilowii]